MGHYVPEGTGEGLCDLSQAGSNIPEGTGAGLCDLSQAGSNTVVNDWKDWRPDTAIKTGTRCSVKMTGSMTGAVLLTVESVLPGSQVRPMESG